MGEPIGCELVYHSTSGQGTRRTVDYAAQTSLNAIFLAGRTQYSVRILSPSILYIFVVPLQARNIRIRRRVESPRFWLD